MVVCVPVAPDGRIDPRWGRADRVALAEVTDGTVVSWNEVDVGWGDAHDAGPEGSHHARIARFLIEHGVETVVAHHMGEGMLHMLRRMGLEVRLGAHGDAREAAAAAAAP
ncbi:MAG TPA: NifB/NifX family molybdenum-iron cluster-binding protein [Actinomycetota bacterium]|nr:NifB/NifX family molybdenum-iron cluster-binding protein [Actinomycetota bacterium]